VDWVWVGLGCGDEVGLVFVLLGLGFGLFVCDVERGVLEPGAGGVSLGSDVDAAVDGDEGRATGPVLQAANVRVKPASVAAMALVHALFRFMWDRNPPPADALDSRTHGDSVKGC
jgi:hypothetical protein